MYSWSLCTFYIILSNIALKMKLKLLKILFCVFPEWGVLVNPRLKLTSYTYTPGFESQLGNTPSFRKLHSKLKILPTYTYTFIKQLKSLCVTLSRMATQ